MFKKKKLILIASLLFTNAFSYAQEGLEALDFNQVNEKENNKETEVDYSSLNLDFSLINLDSKENQKLLNEDVSIKKIRKKIEELDSEFKNADISSVEGFENLYQIDNKKDILYITKDSNYIIPKIYKINENGFEDIQKEKKEKDYSKRLNELTEEYYVLFEANKNATKKGTIFVFSDFTCPYCKKLHKELLNITELGLDVKYIPYPRNGTQDKPALLGLQRIMCADKPIKDFDNAFLDPHGYVKGIDAINSSCLEGKKALHESLTLGDELNVRGTPYIFLDNGVFLGGWTGINTFSHKLSIELSEKQKAK